MKAAKMPLPVLPTITKPPPLHPSAPLVAPPPAHDRPANRVASSITGRPYLSHSQLSAMRSCPKRFEFQYVLQVPVDHQPSSLLFGSSIHAAVELFYRCRLEGLAVTVEALFSRYRDAWNGQRRQVGEQVPVRFNVSEDEDTLDELEQRAPSCSARY